MDVVIDSCNCTRFTSGSDRCRVCGSAQSGPFIDTFDAMPRLIAGVFSGALTGVFALAGAFTGAFMGAIAGRASDSGMLRGAGVGAIAGAVLAVEVLEASRAYWCLQQSGSRGSSSMADFAEELLRGRFVDNELTPRFVDNELTPTVFAAYNWQVTIGSIGYDASNNVVSRGLCRDLLKKLPCHILDEIEARKHVCCTICLQDIKVGETARSLPNCNHTFHLGCVDKWLISHGSCPVCRREL